MHLERARWDGGDPQALALAAGAAGTWRWDRSTGVVDWDAALEALYGLREGSFGGRFEDWVALIHPEDREAALAQLEGTLSSADAHYLLFRAVTPDGSVRWVESRGRVLRDTQGEAEGIVGVCHDVTDREQAQARLWAAEQEVRARLEFLAEASELLGRSLTDLDATLQELTALAVPQLGDWCAIDLVEHDRLRLAAVAHADPAKVQFLRDMVERYGPRPDEGAGKVVATGQVEYVPVITDTMLQQTARDAEHLDMLRHLELASVVIVPLRSRGRVLGALTLAHAESGRRHSEDDVALSQHLARRAAAAVDNANLLADRSRVAAMLQRALLPPRLPDVPSMELASHYDPADNTDIGGDFYDAVGSGSTWTLLIGDVCGKGTRAAALTSLARHTLRAAALRDPDPVHVLGLLNDALLEDEADDSYCTGVCVHLSIADGKTAVVIANGGHPPPLVLRSDGTVEQVTASGRPLGLFDDPDLCPAHLELGPGDLLLLYTDGLSEARRGGELFGVEGVEAALGETAGLTVEATLKQLHDVVEAWQAVQRDDAAMLACRLFP